MDKAVQIAKKIKYSKQQLSSMAMSSTGGHQVHNVKRHKRYNTRDRKPRQEKTNLEQGNTKQKCRNCGTLHNFKSECPAKGKRCHGCNKLKHLKQCVHTAETRYMRSTVTKVMQVIKIQIFMYTWSTILEPTAHPLHSP